MRKITIYLISLFLLPILQIYGQLNEFMIMTYYNGSIPTGLLTPDPFFSGLKGYYKFNTILFIAPPEFVPDEYYKAAKNVGLRSILYTNKLNSKKPEFNKTEINEELQRFSGDEYEVMGYHITDEPDAKTTYWPHGTGKDKEQPFYQYIDNIPPYTNIIKEYDESLLRYVNLYPLSSFGDYGYREEYIQKHIDTANPNLLSFDHYPIFGPNNEYFKSLYDIGLKSTENSIPFIYVLTPYKNSADFFDKVVRPDYYFNAKNINEFRYVIYAALSYGAKGIAYWPGLEWVEQIVGNNLFLKMTEIDKDLLRSLHEKLLANSSTLLSLNFVSAYHKTNVSSIAGYQIEDIHSFCLWSNFINDKYAKQIFTDMRIPLYETSTNDIPDEIAVTFLTNKSGQVYFWLFNKSLSRSLKLKLNLKNTCRDVLNEATVSNENIINLSPGEAKLFTPITQSPLIYTQIADQVYDNEFYPLETAHIFNFGFSTSDANSITFNSGATKSFVANSINIKSMHAKPGSIVRFKSYEDSNKTPSSALLGKNIQAAKYSPTDVEAVSLKEEVYVYPNPANNHIYLHIDLDNSEEIEARICDITGNTIKILTVSENETFIPISEIPAGLFFIHFMRNNNLYNFKVIKR